MAGSASATFNPFHQLAHMAHAVKEFAATVVDEVTKYVTVHPFAAGKESFSATPLASVSSPPPPTTVLPVGQITLWVAVAPGDCGPVAELLVITNVLPGPWAP
jgi:hypothetical protein